MARLRPIAADEYQLMGRAGIFGHEERVELLDGQIFTQIQGGPLQVDVCSSLSEFFVERSGKRWRTRVRNPVRLNQINEPEPDLLLIQPGARRYRERHPAPDDTFLLIEVADSSLEFDLNVKIPIYARTGIPEVWVVDLNEECIRIFRNPQGGRYTSETVETSQASPGCEARRPRPLGRFRRPLIQFSRLIRKTFAPESSIGYAWHKRSRCKSEMLRRDF